MDWRTKARSNPKIQQWYKNLRTRFPNEPEDVVQHMEKSDYDYKKAIESGYIPIYQPEHDEMRWSDIGKTEAYKKRIKTINIEGMSPIKVINCNQKMRNNRTMKVKI